MMIRVGVVGWLVFSSSSVLLVAWSDSSKGANGLNKHGTPIMAHDDLRKYESEDNDEESNHCIDSPGSHRGLTLLCPCSLSWVGGPLLKWTQEHF